PGDHLPLLIDDGALYLQRDLARERRVASAVAARLAPATVADDDLAAALAAALADVVARSPRRADSVEVLSDEQKAAVRAALAQKLLVVAGGPGTGKTATVAALVRVLARLGHRPERIALTAPTGKAAHRMAAALGAILARVEDP